jgi:hypothetical protein
MFYLYGVTILYLWNISNANIISKSRCILISSLDNLFIRVILEVVTSCWFCPTGTQIITLSDTPTQKQCLSTAIISKHTLLDTGGCYFHVMNLILLRTSSLRARHGLWGLYYIKWTCFSHHQQNTLYWKSQSFAVWYEKY